jgi:hypothetical protein
LDLDEDVAGATFMAGGSSSPELFTALIGKNELYATDSCRCALFDSCTGIFVTKGDVGVGTIVGSAVFNIVFVIGVCGLFVDRVNLHVRHKLEC